ncbi:urease accessory protein [Peribacillus huizhouensis]|uniref:Urease accessory protein UreE n=1 Tax=Peribacillus huizhouensis TaxID=1501239 RepID=A0ABR6CML5_9BACI|nr:urease accessory protein [Peribacillus huizhouensis]
MNLLILYQWDKDISYSEVKALIIEQIVTNIEQMATEEIDKRHKEKVYLESADLVKRIQRVTTDHGTEIGIRLKNPRDLVAGDVLFMDDKNMIIIDVLSDDLLVISPRTLKEMGTIAHQLGNRHLPAQFEENEMLVQYDYLVEELLQELQIPFKREDRKVKQAFRHIGHSHES